MAKHKKWTRGSFQGGDWSLREEMMINVMVDIPKEVIIQEVRPDR